MSDHQVETIDHLRGVIKDLQTKLQIRTEMLAQLLPHVQEWAERATDEHIYICFEFCEKYGDAITKFKDEYGRESMASPGRDNILPHE